MSHLRTHSGEHEIVGADDRFGLHLRHHHATVGALYDQIEILAGGAFWN